MMGVHDVGATQDPQQARRDGVRGMPAQPAEGGKRAIAQPAGLMLQAAAATEGDELALDMTGQSSRQRERIALAPAE